LGLAALGVFILNQTHVASGVAGITHTFEVIHYTLFLVAVCHTFFVCLLVYMSERISRYWERIEELEFNHWQELRGDYDGLVHELGLKGHLHTPHLRDRFKRLATALRNPRRWFRLAQLTENVRFHDIRHHFIRANHLPSNFHFVTYLKKCKQHVTLHLTSIHRGVWLGIAWLISADLLFRGMIKDYRQGYIGELVVVLSTVAILMCVGITRKTGNAYWRLLHSELVHFDPANPSTLTFRRLQEDQHSLFWLGRPNLLLNVLQLSIFLISTCIALLIQNMAEITSSVKTPSIVMTVLAASTTVFILPRMVPQYTMVTHTGQFVDLERLSEALQKQQKKFHSRALASQGAVVNNSQNMTLSEMRTQVPVSTKTLRGKTLKVLKSTWFVSAINLLLLVDFFIIAYEQVELQVHGINYPLIAIELFCGSIFILEIFLNIYARGCANYLHLESLPRLLSATLATYSFCVLTVVYHLDAGPLRFWLHASTICITFRFFRRFRLNHEKQTVVDILDTTMTLNGAEEGIPMISNHTLDTHDYQIRSQRDSDNPSDYVLDPTDPDQYILDYSAKSPGEMKEEVPTRVEPSTSVDADPSVVFPQKSEKSALRKDLSAPNTPMPAEGSGRNAPWGSHKVGAQAPGQSSMLRAKKRSPSSPALGSSEVKRQQNHALAQELWEETCRLHPEIASAHGKLSLPIFRLMLGLPAFKINNDMSSRTASSMDFGLEMKEVELSSKRSPDQRPRHKKCSPVNSIAHDSQNEGIQMKRVNTSPSLISQTEMKREANMSSLLMNLQAEEQYWNKVLKFGKVLIKSSSGTVESQTLVLTRRQLVFIKDSILSQANNIIMDSDGMILDQHKDRMTLNTIISTEIVNQGALWIRIKTPDSTFLVRDFEDRRKETEEWLTLIEETMDSQAEGIS